MIWLFYISMGLLIAGMLMGPLYKVLAPAWPAWPAPRRANAAASQPGRFVSRRPNRRDRPDNRPRRGGKAAADDR